MSDPYELSSRYLTTIVATMSLLVLGAIAVIVPVPYVTMKPGPAFDTLGEFDSQKMFTFGEGVRTYPTSGTLDFTTVSVTRADSSVSLFKAISSYFDGDTAVVPKSLIYPDNQSAQDSTAQSAAQLDGSKDSSKVAGLRAAGYKVTGRAQVVDVQDDGAAAGVLKADDIITSVDDTVVRTPDETVKAVGKHEPGDDIRLRIERDGKAETVTIVAGADPQDKTVPRIGISIGTKYSFPFEINNNVGHEIGGPSAGAMFALAIYDLLTPGELTGGNNVAGTGEISADGVVGPIGGIRQKMAGAAQADATIFLVPEANCAEAIDGDDEGLTLVRVSTLDDAISSLEALAKDPDAEVPTCS